MTALNSEIKNAPVPHWIDLIPAPSFLLDGSGAVSLMSEKSREILDLSETKKSELAILDLISLKSVDAYLDIWNSRNDPPDSRANAPMVWVQPFAGAEFPVKISLGKITVSGRPSYLLIFGNVLNTDGSSADEVVTFTEYLSSVRHKFRNPLSGIIVLTDVLLRNTEENLSDRQIEQLAGIREALRRMASLINDIDVPSSDWSSSEAAALWNI